MIHQAQAFSTFAYPLFSIPTDSIETAALEPMAGLNLRRLESNVKELNEPLLYARRWLMLVLLPSVQGLSRHFQLLRAFLDCQFQFQTTYSDASSKRLE
jgi:hypothetical protein